jgi:uncharacterized protein YnzC (UPF0291/DUF896 family)
MKSAGEMKEKKKMEIVVNKCYGGFRLSPLATARLAELKGRKCYFYTDARDASDNLILNGPLVQISMEQAKNEFIWYAYDIPEADEKLREKKKWREMTDEERRAQNKLYDQHSIDHGRELERNDPHLVQVVNELGEKANGPHAKLTIVEVPDGVEWELDEYGGIESVHEKHRVFG